MSEQLLEIKNLRISTNEKILVHDSSFVIERKSIVGLVGESGSGKTISALSVTGLLPKGLTVSSGSILFRQDDQKTDLLKLSEKELNKYRGDRISMIFQEPMTSLNPSMKCGPQAMETLLAKKKYKYAEAKEKILSLFSEVLLPEVDRIFNAWPHELSGGQRQRVMIAMALSTSPDLLIADEPTTALDVTVQKSILDLLLILKDKYNLSILFITHDLMVLNQVADKIVVMYKGKIVESGDKGRIMSKPEAPYTKGLLACKPGLGVSVHPLPTISDFIEGKQVIQGSYQKKAFTGKDIILSIKDLEVTFGKKNKARTAVRKVSFDVFKGETLGLVGESGCGKTTLGRAILQLIDTYSGSVSYKGRKLNELSSKEIRKIRRSVQIVFQDPYSSLNPGKTVGSILSEPLKVHKLVHGKESIENEVIQLLDQVDLPKESINLYPHQFSGGQRQRIGIARALACNPDFIVLDESVSALDVSVQAQILNLLNELKEKYKLTYIFISHDLTVVKYMSDRVMVMSEGRIIESGDPEQIYLNPAENYTKKLISSIPL